VGFLPRLGAYLIDYLVVLVRVTARMESDCMAPYYPVSRLGFSKSPDHALARRVQNALTQVAADLSAFGLHLGNAVAYLDAAGTVATIYANGSYRYAQFLVRDAAKRLTIVNTYLH
jgi:hypothetical protein